MAEFYCTLPRNRLPYFDFFYRKWQDKLPCRITAFSNFDSYSNRLATLPGSLSTAALMVDYQAVAVFLAAATWLATILLGKPMKLFLAWIIQKRLARSYQCQALVWGHLPMTLKSGGLIRTATNSVRWENDRANDQDVLEQISATKAFLEVVDTLFGTRPKNIDRPPYLNEEKKYLRTDGNTLLAFLLSKGQNGEWGPSRNDSSTSDSVFTITAGPMSGRFHRNKHENETYLIGRLLLDSPESTSWKVNPDNYGQPKEVYRLIADGYPPWYRQQIKTHSGALISHPIKRIRGAQRGGWIVGHRPLRSRATNNVQW